MGSRDPLLEFCVIWDRLISRERSNLETSNLARRPTAVSSNENKCKIGSKGVMRRSGDKFLEFWDPPNISRTVEKLQTSNLLQRRIVVSSNKKYKVMSKEVMWGSREPILEFWDP